MLVEVCCFSLESAVAAAAAGAPRIELCSHQELDGVTPTPQLLASVLREYAALRERGAPNVPRIHVMVRPKPRSSMELIGANAFVLSSSGEDRESVLADIDQMPRGVDGIVFGALAASEKGGMDVDWDFCAAVLQRSFAKGIRDVTFHRAFDFVSSHSAGGTGNAVDAQASTAVRLHHLGFTRVLTAAGTPATPAEDRFRALNALRGHVLALMHNQGSPVHYPFVVMPCGGITAHWIRQWKEFLAQPGNGDQNEGCAPLMLFEVHGTFGGRQVEMEEAIREARAP